MEVGDQSGETQRTRIAERELVLLKEAVVAAWKDEQWPNPYKMFKWGSWTRFRQVDEDSLELLVVFADRRFDEINYWRMLYGSRDVDLLSCLTLEAQAYYIGAVLMCLIEYVMPWEERWRHGQELLETLHIALFGVFAEGDNLRLLSTERLAALLMFYECVDQPMFAGTLCAVSLSEWIEHLRAWLGARKP